MVRAALLSVFLISPAMAQDRVITWRFYEYGRNTSIPDEQYRAAVRQALEMYERYFQFDFQEKPGNSQNVNYFIGFWDRSPLVGYGLAVADRFGQWYWRKPGVIYIDPFALAALTEFTGPLTVDGLDHATARPRPLSDDTHCRQLQSHGAFWRSHRGETFLRRFLQRCFQRSRARL